MSDIQNIHTNDGGYKAISLPPCPLCASPLKAHHIGNAHTKTQKLQVKCTARLCRIERTDATIHGDVNDLIRMQEKAWNAGRNRNDL